MRQEDVITRVWKILADLGVPSEQNVSFDWMTNRSPMDEDYPSPPRVRYRLMAIHTRLGGDLSALKQKRPTRLRFDFQVDDMTLIEVDRKEHFSSHRTSTLDFYNDISHSLDVDAYWKLCSKFAYWADRYQAKREAPDFPFPGGRSAQVAYFDAAKDLLVPAYGYRLIRLPAADEELIEDIGLRLRVLL